MRALVVLCLVAVAAAQYDYSQQTMVNTNNGGFGTAQLSQPIQQESEYNKEFYSYSAPEHEFNDVAGQDNVADSLTKHLRVIFIKGPENSGLENAAVQLAKSASHGRTAIYVLQKQADVSELANRLSSLPSSVHKPEVHFVKYKTQADAENAQRTIQSQYDSLPGSSTSTNGGQAPVLDFASKVSAASSNQHIPPQQQPQASYLPPGRRF